MVKTPDPLPPTATVELARIERFLDDVLEVARVPVDSAFSRFVPIAYDSIGFPWRERFESGFATRFNGLMRRGAARVGKIWCIVFPSEEALDEIVGRSRPGDLIFSQHPIKLVAMSDMERDDTC